MNTFYIKRHQVFECEEWGIQVSPCRTHLLRATVIGKIGSQKRLMRVIWEWVATGQRIDGENLKWIMRRYPVCEFQSDEDLAWRASRKWQPKWRHEP